MNCPDCGVINPHNTAGRTDSSPARQSGSIHLRGLKGRNNCCREGEGEGEKRGEEAQEVKQNPGEKTSAGFSAMFSSSASGNESTRGGEEVELRSLFAGVALRH